jgi:hypothetical protein
MANLSEEYNEGKTGIECDGGRNELGADIGLLVGAVTLLCGVLYFSSGSCESKKLDKINNNSNYNPVERVNSGKINLSATR